MKSNYFENQYTNSYYYANIVNNIIMDQHDYIGFISEFFVHFPVESIIVPWQKKTVFHCFINYIVMSTIEEEGYENDIKQLAYAKANKEELGELYIEWLLEKYVPDYFTFTDYCKKQLVEITEDDIHEYYNELYFYGIEGLYDLISEEVFYLLFNNRELLLAFNLLISRYIEDISLDEFDENFSENIKYMKTSGRLKRQNIPAWVKNAVYFRDKGKCCLCKKDLSGILSLDNSIEYDHIVPLAEGGTNDVTNIQLLCNKCNKKKSSILIQTSNLYEKWF